jgi:hypothetical protein
MGFVRDKKVFFIRWEEDTEFSGLEIRARSVSTGKYLKIFRLAKAVEESDNSDVTTQHKILEELFEIFATVLISWNVQEHADPDDEDSPLVDVPATKDGLYSVDVDMALTVIYKWISCAAGVPDELGKESTSGDLSVEASIPMEILSDDHQRSLKLA